MDALAATIPAQPKAELHLHLVGAMPREFFAEQLEKYTPEEAFSDALPRHFEFLSPHKHLQNFLPGGPAAPLADDLFRFPNFEGFLGSYFLSTFFLRDLDDLRRLVQAVRHNLVRENITYAEITISPTEHLYRESITVDSLAAFMDEVADQPGTKIRWIVDTVRNLGVESGLNTIKSMLSVRPKSWVGITIGGAEHQFPPAQFKPIYRLAKDAGLRLSVHAGEAAGPESVWDAIRVLGAERIGHGVRSIEDPKLVEYLAEHQIPLEVCPTGNIRTGVYASPEQHPIKRLFDAGVPLTLSTDDPTFFGVSLTDEYLFAAQQGLTEAELDVIRQNGFDYAFG
jgi:aminodeoxyfutalosine deaminase